jgi:hypothetical protein
MEPLEILLGVGETIRGRVVDEQGRPGAGVVVAYSEKGAYTQANVAADGNFEMNGLEPGRYQVSATDWTGDRMGVALTTSGAIEPLVIEQRRRHALNVVVTDTAGTPRENVWLSVTLDDAFRNGIAFVASDAQGRAQISAPAGRYRLLAQTGTNIVGSADVVVDPQRTEPVRLVIDSAARPPRK